ncbi:hypothetical protein KJ855_02515 [Patescibacteria group bacterium]|nr:hypothetical protein [Patescibacteria group bacterium]
MPDKITNLDDYRHQRKLETIGCIMHVFFAPDKEVKLNPEEKKAIIKDIETKFPSNKITCFSSNPLDKPYYKETVVELQLHGKIPIHQYKISINDRSDYTLIPIDLEEKTKPDN